MYFHLTHDARKGAHKLIMKGTEQHVYNALLRTPIVPAGPPPT